MIEGRGWVTKLTLGYSRYTTYAQCVKRPTLLYTPTTLAHSFVHFVVIKTMRLWLTVQSSS